MDLGIEDRVAIVTGSSRGIGRAIARGLSIEGVDVVICARKEGPLKEAADEISRESGRRVVAVRTDLAIEGDISGLVEKTIDLFGRVDILVNNTGGPPAGRFDEISSDDWNKSVELILMSVQRICSLVIPHMRKNGWGRIINMTSIAAKQPLERMVLSNTIRAGILGLTKTLANEVARDNILVNSVCPGWTLTDRVDELASSKARDTGSSKDEIIRGWEEGIPLGRMARPGELADLVVYLSSERASYLTGTVIQVDGGATRSLF
jgi:3-oxoacyl-[acyl-carrier protein] reductase